MQKIYISFTKEELDTLKKLAELAYEIDISYYNVPTPEEEEDDDKILNHFIDFKRKFLYFNKEFRLLIVNFARLDNYNERRITECDNLLDKLSENISILKTHNTFWEKMPTKWNIIYGKNMELDYFIEEFIKKQCE